MAHKTFKSIRNCDSELVVISTKFWYGLARCHIGFAIDGHKIWGGWRDISQTHSQVPLSSFLPTERTAKLLGKGDSGRCRVVGSWGCKFDKKDVQRILFNCVAWSCQFNSNQTLCFVQKTSLKKTKGVGCDESFNSWKIWLAFGIVNMLFSSLCEMKLQTFVCSSKMSPIQSTNYRQMVINWLLSAFGLSIYFFLSKARFLMAVSITERFMQEFMYGRPVGEKKDRIA